MLVLWIMVLYDQLSSRRVHNVARNTGLQHRQCSIIRGPCSPEHSFDSSRNLVGPNKVYPLNVATIALILHAKVEFDKIPVPNSRSTISNVTRFVIAHVYRRTPVESPRRIQASLPEKFVCIIMNVFILLSGLNVVLNLVIDLLAFPDRFLDQSNLFWDES